MKVGEIMENKIEINGIKYVREDCPLKGGNDPSKLKCWNCGNRGPVFVDEGGIRCADCGEKMVKITGE